MEFVACFSCSCDEGENQFVVVEPFCESVFFGFEFIDVAVGWVEQLSTDCIIGEGCLAGDV